MDILSSPWHAATYTKAHCGSTGQHGRPDGATCDTSGDESLSAPVSDNASVVQHNATKNNIRWLAITAPAWALKAAVSLHCNSTVEMAHVPRSVTAAAIAVSLCELCVAYTTVRDEPCQGLKKICRYTSAHLGDISALGSCSQYTVSSRREQMHRTWNVYQGITGVVVLNSQISIARWCKTFCRRVLPAEKGYSNSTAS